MLMLTEHVKTFDLEKRDNIEVELIEARVFVDFVVRCHQPDEVTQYSRQGGATFELEILVGFEMALTYWRTMFRKT